MASTLPVLPLVSQLNVDIATKVSNKFDWAERPMRLVLSTGEVEYQHNHMWVDRQTLFDMLTGNVMEFF